MEPLLVPRVEAYSQNHALDDIEEVADYLRSSYREYQRKPAAAFRVMVGRAVSLVRLRGPPRKPELRAMRDGASFQAAPEDGDSEGKDGDDDSDDEVVGGKDGQDGAPAGTSLYTELAAPAFGTLPMEQTHTGRLSGTTAAALAAVAAAAARRPPPPSYTPSYVALSAPQPAAAGAPLPVAGAAAAATPAQPPAGILPGKYSPFVSTQSGGVAGVRGGRPPMKASVGAKRGRGSDPPAGREGKRTRVTKDASDGAVHGGGGGGGDDGGLSLPSAGPPRGVRFADLGGIEGALGAIKELVEYPLAHPELYTWLGVAPPRGVLLHGPPGCGKTTLAHAVAQEAGVPFFAIAAPEVVSGMSGESEAKVRALFAAAAAAAPCIVFIDEIDAIAPKRESAQREMERRIVAQLLACMDDLAAATPAGIETVLEGDGVTLESTAASAVAAARLGRGHVVVIGATNRPDALDPALRRAGRFDREIALGVPDEAARARILAVLARRLRLDGALDLRAIASRTGGYVGADLAALTQEAAAAAISRIFKTLASASPSLETNLPGVTLEAQWGLGRPLAATELAVLSIRMSDFEAALRAVQPSAQREGFSTVPGVTWAQVGAMGDVHEELSFAITAPIRHPAAFAAMGLAVATGVLLYGPPGCGKTLVAKAVANEAGANFISVKGPELLNKYVGESERAVRTLFSRARAAAPCVLFFDELDALAPRRGGDSGGAGGPSERVVNTLLTEMDGLEPRRGVYLIAATNRPDMIDPAMLRPGRLDKLLYVPLPAAAARAAILATLARGAPIAAGVDVAVLASAPRAEGFSGADLASLLREACVAALRESALEGLSAAALAGPVISDAGAAASSAPAPRVELRHFESAFERVQPSVSEVDRKRYDNLALRLRRSRGAIAAAEPERDAPEVRQ